MHSVIHSLGPISRADQLLFQLKMFEMKSDKTAGNKKSLSNIRKEARKLLDNGKTNLLWLKIVSLCKQVTAHTSKRNILIIA